MRNFGIAVICLLISGHANAADFAKIGPLASAESIMSARSQLHETGVEFTVTVSGGNQDGTWTVDLAPDFMAVSDSSKITITDYALRRIIALNERDHSFGNSSLYGFVDFLAAETYNRRFINQMLLKATVKDASQDAFWTQSELHVIDSADAVPAIERSPAKDGAVFSYQGKTVASYTLSAQNVSNDERAWLARYLTMNTALHPRIIAEIVESKRMPQHITYVLSAMHKGETVEMAFKPLTLMQVAYPLREDSKPTPLDAARDPAVLSTMQLMMAAAKGQLPDLKKEADYHAAIDKALSDGHAFQAILLMLEMNEQFGAGSLACTEPCHSGTEIVAAAKVDPRSEALLRALEPKNKDEMEAAIKSLQTMKRDDLSNAYVIDDFLANDLVKSGNANEALPLFVAAIKGNPYLAGYYKDVGDLYRMSFYPELAWFCYDVGRALPGGADAPVISQINEYEAKLAAKYPQFF